MDLIELFQTLFRRKWLIIATAVIATIVATIGSFLVTPSYSAAALIRVSASPNPLVERADVQYAQQLMNTYIIIGRTRPILQKVIEQAGLDISSKRLNDMIDIKAIEETELIEITVNNSDPEEAALIANTIANVLISQTTQLSGVVSASDAVQEQLNQINQELDDMRKQYDTLLVESPGEVARITDLSRQITVKQQTYEALSSQYEEVRLSEAIRVSAVTFVEEASVPTSPVFPRKTLNIGLGAALGILTGSGLALLLSNLDTRIYSASQVKNMIDLPILAELSKSAPSQVRFREMLPVGRESYRRLRANLFALRRNMELKTVMISSPQEDEGKSTITYNLAMSVAQLGHSVLVMDCDMRNPSQHKLFEIPNTVGLSTVLEKKISLSEALQEVGIHNLRVLTSGPTPSDPTQLLSSEYMKDLLREMSPRFDIILLDSPAVLPVVDMALLAPIVNGVLLVIRSGKTNRHAVMTAHSQIEEVQGQILGVVMNDANVKLSQYHTAE